MSLLEKELGKPLTPKELSEEIGFDEKFIRDHYIELGGIRIGRHFKFFEKEVLNAIQAWKEIHRPSEEEREENRKGVPDEEGSPEVGSRNRKDARRRMEREDEHGLLI